MAPESMDGRQELESFLSNYESAFQHEMPDLISEMENIIDAFTGEIRLEDLDSFKGAALIVQESGGRLLNKMLFDEGNIIKPRNRSNLLFESFEGIADYHQLLRNEVETVNSGLFLCGMLLGSDKEDKFTRIKATLNNLFEVVQRLKELTKAENVRKFIEMEREHARREN